MKRRWQGVLHSVDVFLGDSIEGLRSSIRNRSVCGLGRFANRPYDGLMFRGFSFQLRNSYPQRRR